MECQTDGLIAFWPASLLD